DPRGLLQERDLVLSFHAPGVAEGVVRGDDRGARYRGGERAPAIGREAGLIHTQPRGREAVTRERVSESRDGIVERTARLHLERAIPASVPRVLASFEVQTSEARDVVVRVG